MARTTQERPVAGKVALVTGGSRRIGRLIALRLAAEGAAIAVNARASRQESEGVVGEIMAAGGQASSEYVLTLSCPDRVGIVHAVAAYLHLAGCNVLDSQQFGDRTGGRFFMRVHMETVPGAPVTYESLYGGFAPVAAEPIPQSRALLWVGGARVSAARAACSGGPGEAACAASGHIAARAFSGGPRCL